jgi:hypothetical protein
LASDAVDEFRLEAIAELHAVSAAMFVPFVIHRFAEIGGQAEIDIQVELRDIGASGSAVRRMRLRWDTARAMALPPGVAETTITEWAALGVACAVVWHYGGLRLSAVSLDGDRFDYWVDREGTRWGLEVSGTIAEDVEQRHRQKVRQLRDNPHGVDGYVVVVGLAARRVIFSFHRFAEDNS